MSFRCRCIGIRLLALAALGAAGAACTPFKTDLPGDADAPDSAARGDAAEAGIPDPMPMIDASDAGAYCGHSAPVGRPTVMDAGGSLDLVLAVSESSNRGSNDAGQQSYTVVGFDLDNTCTPAQGDSCVEPPWANADHTDGNQGIDNAWGEFELLTVHVDAKTPTMLFRVTSYSGQADDDQVEVSLYAGLGLAPRNADDDGGTGPLWDGRDRWQIMPEMLAPSASPSVDEPLYRDDQAYVSGGTLVAHFRNALWSPGNYLAPYVLTPANQIVLAGSLTQVGGQWVLQDAMVDMRIRINDVLAGAGQVPDEMAPGEVVCQNNVLYDAVRQALCASVDIASMPGPPSAPCDALSTAALFQAEEAQLGYVRLPSPPPAPCAQGIDPATDTCGVAGD